MCTYFAGSRKNRTCSSLLCLIPNVAHGQPDAPTTEATLRLQHHLYPASATRSCKVLCTCITFSSSSSATLAGPVMSRHQLRYDRCCGVGIYFVGVLQRGPLVDIHCRGVSSVLRHLSGTSGPPITQSVSSSDGCNLAVEGDDLAHYLHSSITACSLSLELQVRIAGLVACYGHCAAASYRAV